MLEMKEELIIFVLAIISGLIVRLVYRCISCFRQIVKHGYLAMGIEDVVFWVGVSVYLFVQIYHTSSGSIRWYFALGVVFGVFLMSLFLKKVEELFQKIYTRRKKDLSETLEPQKEKR